MENSKLLTILVEVDEGTKTPFKAHNEILSLFGVVGQSELLVCKGKCDHGYNDEFGNELFCSIKEKNTN